MDYEQHMYGRSSYDPSRARGQMHREGGVGGVLLLVGVIVAALAIVIWMAGSNAGGDLQPTAPSVGQDDAAATIPTDAGAVPATE
ncbi:hypothetical protein [Defluviimonas sp. SAOS-178_SWC]|uniref:hypothetical protein n=1 Tax=Defluviimonas sp. SAOS-178_SWC TaxID=3121287 RepID=UPI003221BE27